MKKQLKITLVLTILAALFSGCSYEEINGNGPVVEEERSVGAFTSLSLRLPAKLYVYNGNESSVSIQTNENVQRYIETTVINDELIIETIPNVSIRNTDVLNIYVTSDLVSSFSIDGSGLISIEDCLDAAALSFDINGSGDIKACGLTDVLSVVINGSGKFKGFDLEAGTAELNIRGSGDIEISVNDVLEADISGSGKIEYYGTPQVSQQISGSGKVRKKN